MKIFSNPFISQNLRKSVSFQSGELNNEFPEYLRKATEDEDAQPLLRCVHKKTITPSPERLAQVKEAINQAEDLEAKAYLSRVVTLWTEKATNN